MLRLTPAVDWAAYLPHIPHGLLGLQAVFRLRPLLAEASFLRILATQLHAFAHEGRSPAGRGLGAIGSGSGHWGNLQHGPGAPPARHRLGRGPGHGAGRGWEQFRLLERAAEADMANVGHKSVLARLLGELFLALGEPPEAGRTLLALAAWQCASEPVRHASGTSAPPAAWRAPARCRTGRRPRDAEAHRAQAREICDSGLVDLLDRFSARVRSGAGSGDLLAALALAAAEKQLDARRDLEAQDLLELRRACRPGPAGGTSRAVPRPRAWCRRRRW